MDIYKPTHIYYMQIQMAQSRPTAVTAAGPNIDLEPTDMPSLVVLPLQALLVALDNVVVELTMTVTAGLETGDGISPLRTEPELDSDTGFETRVVEGEDKLVVMVTVIEVVVDVADAVNVADTVDGSSVIVSVTKTVLVEADVPERVVVTMEVVVEMFPLVVIIPGETITSLRVRFGVIDR